MVLDPLTDVPSRNEQAYEAIKEAILSLAIRPGEVLAIGRLAEQLGISRTPVRDALLRLETDGLVTMIPQRGAYVTEIRELDIQEMYELTILLESYAARVATPKLSAADLERVEMILQETERAFEAEDRIKTVDLGRSIHDLLIDKVGNSRLKACVDELEMHYTRIRRFVSLIPGRLEKSCQQHEVLFEALRNGDAVKAEKQMADHLASVRDDLLANADIWRAHLGNGGAAGA